MFVNETKNNVENNVKAGVAMTRKVRILLLVMGLVVTLLGIIMEILYYTVLRGEDDFFGILLIVLGAALLVFYAVFPAVFRKTLVKNMQGKESVVRYTFTDEGYEIFAEDTSASSSVTKGNYSAFTECREEKEFWLLYYNKAAMYILSKYGMKEGTEQEFTEFLKQKLGSRYKTTHKKK